MNPRPIGKPGVQHGVFVGNLAANPLGDVVDRRPQRVFAGESKAGGLESAMALDVHVLRPIDHDLGDGFIL
jgi:hypothetical protein